jgi:ribosomal protein L37AE/L43A
MNSTGCSSDNVIQPKHALPKPIVLVKKLTENTIQELTAGIWRCGFCGKTKKSFLILDLLIDTGCEKFSPIECDVCPAVIRDYKSFAAHIIEHQMGHTRTCPICLQECVEDLKQILILQRYFSTIVSESDLQRNISLVLSQSLSASVCTNLSELETEASKKLKAKKSRRIF